MKAEDALQLANAYTRKTFAGSGAQKGEKGDPGKDGKSAYQIWIDAGNVGDEAAFLESIKGKPGKDGAPGSKGDKGDKGDTGATGAAGKNGSDASVTTENIKTALGYTPADESKVSQLSEEIENKYGVDNQPPYPVNSVNGKTGIVALNAEDVAADPSGTAEFNVRNHNTSDAAHNDIRLLIKDLTAEVTAFLDSDDATLDQASEFIAYMKANRSLIESITTSKISVTDIIDDLETNLSNKPLSAAQGVVLKNLIDAIRIPTKTSQLTNDSGFLTKHQDISGLAPKATTLAGYGITDAAKKSEILVVLKCSELGMTKNDDNGNNFTLLCDAIEKADRIIVDDMYKLKDVKKYNLNKSLELEGLGLGSGFEYISGGSLFEIKEGCSQISVKNVKFVNTTTNLPILLNRDASVRGRMIFLRIENCTFEGKISPARFYQSVDINPEETAMGVGTISIINNTFRDINCTGFIFTDVSYNILEVVGNTIKNFENIFVHAGVTNGATYEREITNCKKHIIVQNNDVMCDDAFYHSDQSTSTYYTFVLAEGVNATYQRNKVEGMKSKVATALYDTYLSCENVVYEYNIWKNNCVLIPEENNNLIKAKGNGGDGAGKRKYYNNTFIVEQEFLDKHGAAADCYVSLLSNTSENAYDIQSNTIDVVRLKGYSSSSLITGMIFKNNIIHCTEWVDGAILAGIGDAEVIFAGNLIECDNGENFRGFASGNYVPAKLIYTDNTLVNCCNPIANGNAKKFVFAGNTFVDKSTKQTQLSGGEYGTITGFNNKVTKRDGICSLFGGTMSDSIDYTASVTSKGLGDEIMVLQVKTGATCTLVIEMDSCILDGYANTKGYITLNITDKYVQYVDQDGNKINQDIAASVNFAPQVTMLSGKSLPINIMVFTNYQSSGYVAIKYNIVTTKRLRTDVRILSSDPAEIITENDVLLPEEYTRVEYIETSGTQYIDTGVLASEYSDAGLNFYFNGRITIPQDVDYVFGITSSSAKYYCYAYKQSSTGEMRYRICCGKTNDPLLDWLTLEDIDTKLDIEKMKTTNPASISVKMDGQEIKGKGDIESAPMPDIPLWLFRCNGSSRPGITARIYQFKINNATDNAPVRNYIPCYRNDDGVVGMWDAVTETFYVNAGTGTFGKGADV